MDSYRPASSADGSSDVILSLRGVTKTFGTYKAINEISLDIQSGEVFSLLGPSGCGKSTTLRQIAGLDQPSAGTIKLRDKILFSSRDRIAVPTQKRNMGMVFQSYAIWPHLSIYETVAYPLRIRKMPAKQIDIAVRAMIEQVMLSGMEFRSSSTLSGGQQQRVALARALVYKPEVLLLDEPFSNLDVKLREQMRVELRALQRELGVTIIMVTHDQVEALSLSDRIAVMNIGRIEQVGTPTELYERPATPFVRDFIGQTTKLPATVISIAATGAVEVALGTDEIRMTSTSLFVSGIQPGSRVLACIRPEDIILGSPPDATRSNDAPARIDDTMFLGDRYECMLTFSGEKISTFAPHGVRLVPGSVAMLHIDQSSLSLWPYPD